MHISSYLKNAVEKTLQKHRNSSFEMIPIAGEKSFYLSKELLTKKDFVLIDRYSNASGIYYIYQKIG